MRELQTRCPELFATVKLVNTPQTSHYEPRGAAQKLLDCTAGEVLISGPANTGKTRACLEKLHRAAIAYPGMRALICRKTRASLTESVLVTLETKGVIPLGHPALQGPSRAHRQAYQYPNGSAIVVGGMDNPTRTLSTEYDAVYIPEAIELSEPEWEMLIRPLRNGRMPYHQLLADTNPDAPTHWLKQRCDRGQCLMLESRHEDNPACTPAYLAALESSLTGPRLQRLRYGRWVQAEGVVYEGWDAAVHVIDRFPIPKTWTHFWSIDFGFTNPFGCGFFALDPDGRIYLHREICHSQRLVEDHAKRIMLVSAKEPKPVAIVCDHDAEGRATLVRHLGMSTVPAFKDIRTGIQAVASRLRVQPDGKPRFFVFRDSLDERDPILSEKKLPCCFAEEVDGYIWDISNNRKKGEEPVDKNNHICDLVRYAIQWADARLRVPDGKASRPWVYGS